LSLMERRGGACGPLGLSGSLGLGLGGAEGRQAQDRQTMRGQAEQYREGEETRGDRGLLYLLAVLESSPQALAYFLHLSLWLTIRNY
jgi:hypothetical protein